MKEKFISFWKELIDLSYKDNFLSYEPYVQILLSYSEAVSSSFILKLDRFIAKSVYSIPSKFELLLETEDFYLLEESNFIHISEGTQFSIPKENVLVFLPIQTQEIEGAFVLELPKEKITDEYKEFLENARLALKARFRHNSLYKEVQRKVHQFNVVMETLPEAIIYFEENGNYVWLNTVARRILNLEESVSQPTTVSVAMNELRKKANDYEQITRQALEFFKSGASCSEDWYWTFGNPIHLVYKVNALKTSYQNTHGQVWVLEDVTQNYLSSLEIKRLNEEIKQKALIAENANNAKSIFLANMSHELRTPLNAILGFSQILLQTSELKKSEKEHVQFIYKSGEHLLNLINDILDLSKVEAGKYELFFTNFSLPALIITISKMIELKAIEKGLKFEVSQSPNLPKIIKFDEQKLKQVLLNLLSNAVKYTDKGEVILSVLLLETKGTKHKILFSVRDTGCGIPEKHIQDIFIPFEQLNSGNTFIQGTGLGLAITKSFVELMGSKIHVVSQVGKGSTFSFQIEVEEETSFLEEEISIGDVIGYTGEKFRILIVDDILLNRILLDEILVNLGFETCLVNSGEKALEILESFHPHLIFMDLKMRGMSGFEVIAKIRQHSKFQNVKIIATSASAFNETRNKCLEAGADEFLAKPIQRHELLSKITLCLKPNWIYKEEINFQEDKTEFNIKGSLPRNLIETFLELAKKGDIAKLEELIIEAKQKFPEHISLWEKFEKFVNYFEINLLIERLNSILRTENEPK